MPRTQDEPNVLNDEHASHETYGGKITAYQPLKQERGEFRLLRINPHHPSDDMTCEMAIFSLHEKVSYTALSYRWTNDQPTCIIKLHTTTCTIRPNLDSILRSLRTENFEDWIFVDAICINQEDLAEKAAQVSLMGEIFGKAASVISWTNTASLIVDQDRLILDYCSDKIDLDDLAQNDGEDASAQLWAICDTIVDVFVDWEYWSRLWIVQEVILPETLIIRSGQFKIRAELLIRVLDLVQASKADVGPLQIWSGNLLRNPSKCDSPELRRGMYCFAAWKILSMRHAKFRAQQTASCMPISDAVSFFAVQDCLTQHDKVFGLFGISNLHFAPDYSMSVIELYLRVLNEGLYVGPAPEEDEYCEEAIGRDTQRKPSSHSKPFIHRPIEKTLAKLYQFSVVLRVALNLPLVHPVVMLLTRETFMCWERISAS